MMPPLTAQPLLPVLRHPPLVAGADVPLLWFVQVTVGVAPETGHPEPALRLRARFASTVEGVAATIRISSCAHPPTRGDDGQSVYHGQVEQVSLTATSAQLADTARFELGIVRDPTAPWRTFVAVEGCSVAFQGLPDIRLTPRAN